eukprot:scaffold126481_cov28-Prasinocladus_malaysianus.AAC.1
MPFLDHRIAAAAQEIASTVANTPGTSTPTGAAYWGYHSIKNVFFAAQVCVSLIGQPSTFYSMHLSSGALLVSGD